MSFPQNLWVQLHPLHPRYPGPCLQEEITSLMEREHYAQNRLWKKLKLAGMRPWFLNYAMFSDAESVVFKILTLAKGFLFNFFVLG